MNYKDGQIIQRKFITKYNAFGDHFCHHYGKNFSIDYNVRSFKIILNLLSNVNASFEVFLLTPNDLPSIRLVVFLAQRRLQIHLAFFY